LITAAPGHLQLGRRNRLSRAISRNGTAGAVYGGVESVAEEVGVAAGEGVAVGEPATCGVSVGDAELVGVAFAVGVDVVAAGDGVRVGAGEVELEVEDCPVVEGVSTAAGCVGLTST
jgi:hypothetical protein